MQRSHFLLWQGDGGDESPPEAESIFVAPFEQGEIGPDLFRAACGMGLQRSISVECDDQRRLLPHFVLIVLAVKQRY
jgi:hypothetical protein